jgi:putative DNA primase/helicase
MIMNKVEMPPNLVAFLLKYYPGGLFYANETFYRYHEGAWEQIEESVDVRKRLARLFGASAEAKVINESVVLLKDFLVISSASLTQHKHLICLRNGTLDTLSYELLPHSPSHRLLNRTDIEWNAEAECPRWIQFLDECFVEDSDKEQKIAFMQEWMGYCLVPDISQQKFVWMVGAGGNGKSVLLSVLERLVGGHNVSHAYMERLGDKFVRAELEGKLLNVSSEMSAEATISDGYFKSIVAGDIIEAERKYKPFIFLSSNRALDGLHQFLAPPARPFRWIQKTSGDCVVQQAIYRRGTGPRPRRQARCGTFWNSGLVS